MTRWGRTMGKAVAGSLIVEEEGRYYNRLLFIKPSGERVQSDKRHLFSIGGEGANFCPGRERVVVEYGGIRFLLQVCYDLRFPVWSRCRNDYDAIIYVASWPAGRRDVWRTLLRAGDREPGLRIGGEPYGGRPPAALFGRFGRDRL